MKGITMAKGRKTLDPDVDDLARSLDAGTLLPVYLLTGEEPFLRHRARNLLHDVIVGKLKGSVSVFTGDDPLEKVLEDLRGDSLFAPRRMVEVVQADRLLRERCDAIVRYIERPSASGVLVLDAMKVDGRTKLPGAVRKAGMIVGCPLIYDDRLAGWVQSEAARRKCRISSSAVALLVDEVGNNLFALSAELDKLVTYAGAGKTIEAPDVARLTGNLHSWGVWALSDALGRKEAAEALRILASLLEEEPTGIGVIGMLNWHVSRLARGKFLTEAGGNRNDLISKLGVKPMQVQGLEEQIARFTKQDLARILHMLLDLDISLKTSAMDPKTAIEKFLVEACRGK